MRGLALALAQNQSWSLFVCWLCSFIAPCRKPKMAGSNGIQIRRPTPNLRLSPASARVRPMASVEYLAPGSPLDWKSDRACRKVGRHRDRCRNVVERFEEIRETLRDLWLKQ